jgi:cell division protein FtsL
MRRLKFNWKYALLIVGVLVLALLVIDFNSRMADMRKLSLQRDKVAAEQENLERTKANLETEIAVATSDEAVVQWAYEDGDLILPEDNPVVPLPPGESTPVPTPTPQVEYTQVSNWQMWLALFVDEGVLEAVRLP